MNPPADHPTRARLIVLALLCAMAFILYLDRVCMSQAVIPIQNDLNLSRSRMTWILMAFTVAYGLFEIPTGHWGDRFGSRRVLTRIVAWWSVFTMLTGACFGFWSLVVVRFIFGAGEAGAYPNAARVVARWFPPAERGRVQGLMLACGLLGGSLSPGLAALLISALGWRAVFVAFGSVGLVWAVAFAWWFRDNPAEHPAVNDAERELIGAGTPRPTHSSIPWPAVLKNISIQFLTLIIICTAFVSYLYFSWYPTYLQEARAVQQRPAGWLASLVLGGGAVGLIGGGFVVDQIARRSRDPVRARGRAAVVALVASAGLLALAITAESPLVSALLTAASCFAMFCQQSAWWSSAIEVSGPHVGALFGLMNGAGVVGALSSQFFFGAFPEWRAELGFTGRDRWDPAFYVCVALLVLAGACWLAVDPRRRIEAHGPQIIMPPK